VPRLPRDNDFLLRVDSLTAGYSAPVVGPISFGIRPREIVGLCGPNGSGKSTLFKALSGSARVFGGTVNRRDGLRMSHQHQNPLPLENVPLSGRELLALTGGSTAGLPGWIAPLIGRRLDRLSNGQLQFLQVWASLRAPVDLVLLDEPTNNLDPDSVGFLARTLKQKDSHPAIILISHDADFLGAVCDRTVEVAR
jgi:zinc transport system ATP-binding protein